MVPSVSIISIARNNESGLARTFQSVMSQTHTDWELILVIAPSSDGTLELASYLADSDPRIITYPQTSLGIYSAMNEGLHASSGEYVWFLNSGDEFMDENSLDAAARQMKILSADLLIGGYTISGQSSAKQYSKRSKKISSLDFAFNRRGGCHQAMLFKKKKLLDLNGFGLEFQLASDFDVILRIIEGGKTFRTQKVLARIEPGGISDQRIFDVIREKHQIRRTYYSKNIFVLFLSVGWGLAVKTKIRARNFFGLQ
jgi:glycosyltransferase involved in cell wall biosynthesis